MKQNTEKTAIIKKISDNPNLTLEEIALEFGISLRTLLRRLKHYGIEHGRKRGRRREQFKTLKNV